MNIKVRVDIEDPNKEEHSAAGAVMVNLTEEQFMEWQIDDTARQKYLTAIVNQAFMRARLLWTYAPERKEGKPK